MAGVDRLETDGRRQISDVRLERKRQIDDRGIGRRSLGHQIALAQLQAVEVRRQLIGEGVRHEDIVAGDEVESLLRSGPRREPAGWRNQAAGSC